MIPVQEPKIKWLILSTKSSLTAKMLFYGHGNLLKSMGRTIVTSFFLLFYHTEILTPSHVGIFGLADIFFASLALKRNQLLSCWKLWTIHLKPITRAHLSSPRTASLAAPRPRFIAEMVLSMATRLALFCRRHSALANSLRVSAAKRAP